MLARLAESGIIAFEIVDEFSDQIGVRLAEAREAAGLSIDDVIFRTRIPRGVIVALEAGDFTFFSSPTYAKSFLGQYSGFLGVEATRWLDALQPAYFIADETVSPFLSSTDSLEVVSARNSGSSGNWISTFVLFALTAGVIIGTIEGVEYFDARFDAEDSASAKQKKETSSMTPLPSAPVSDSQAGENVAASPELSEEIPAKKPPRALIVPETDF